MAYITYIAKRQIEPTGYAKTSTDLSSIGADDSIDAVSTVLTGLLADQWVQTSGFSRGANAGWFQAKADSTSGKLLTLTPPISHLRLPGVNGNYASTPDSAAASITTDIDLRAKIAAVDYTSASSQLIVGKDDGGSNRDYSMFVLSTGALLFLYSTDGTTIRQAGSSALLTVADGSVIWVRATYATGSGAVNFYTSPDGVTWTALGTTQTLTAGAIHNGSGTLNVGAAGGTSPFFGRIYYAEVRNGINGAVAAAFDATLGARNASSFVAATGETWTINASGTPPAMLQGALIVDEGAEYLNLTGASGSYASTPDSAAVSVTGSIELTAKAALADWTPASSNVLIAKDDNATNRDYLLTVNVAGVLLFFYSSDGTTLRTASSSVSVPFADGAIGWCKVTYDSATGNVKFYTSADGVTFIQLGTTQVITAGAIHNGTTALYVGTSNNTSLLNGKIYYAEVRNGIGGPVVAAFDPGRAPAAAGSLVAYTGEAWTINSPASLVRTTAVTLTGYKRGYGQSYNFEFKAEAVDRKVKVKRSEQQPLDPSRPPETLLYGQRATVDVLTEILQESSQMPQFREFLASASAGEVFTFDRYGTVASPVDPRLAQLDSADYSEQRSMKTLAQRMPFTVRLLS